jgi:hypothetical protein
MSHPIANPIISSTTAIIVVVVHSVTVSTLVVVDITVDIDVNIDVDVTVDVEITVTVTTPGLGDGVGVGVSVAIVYAIFVGVVNSIRIHLFSSTSNLVMFSGKVSKIIDGCRDILAVLLVFISKDITLFSIDVFAI